jgi:hypothetical protein
MQTQIDLHRYTVVQPGKAVRQFDTGEAAIKYLVDHPVTQSSTLPMGTS